jgi:transcriptional regulator GlxA family with amidase domain
MRRELDTPSAVSPFLVRGLFFRLLVFLARRHSNHERAVSSTRNETTPAKIETSPQSTGVARSSSAHNLAAVLRFCEEHFNEPLSVPHLAALMFLSPGRFTQIFAREMGTTPAAFIRRLRLERAQTLLRTTDMPATEIALNVGFNDLAQFSRAFRAIFNTTPRAYRSAFKT